jgi:hypothetical protein
MENIYDDTTSSGLSAAFWEQYFTDGLKINKELYESRIIRFKKRLQETNRFNDYVDALYKHYHQEFFKCIESKVQKRKLVNAKHCDEDGRYILKIQTNGNHKFFNYTEENQQYWGKDFVWNKKIQPIIDELFSSIIQKALEHLVETGKIKVIKKRTDVINQGQGFYEFKENYADFVLLEELPINQLIQEKIDNL